MPSEMLYRIIDEPDDSPLSKYAVKPLWPWLAMAMGGAWIGVPWFIFNAIALGSPTRRREIPLAAALPFAQVGLAIAAAMVVSRLNSSVEDARGFVLIALALLKMACGYLLFIWQSRAAELHEHFGKELRNGALIAVGAVFIADRVFAVLPPLVGVALR